MDLPLRRVHATDGFALLPPHACAALQAQDLPLPLVLQLSRAGGKDVFVAWCGGSSASRGASDAIELPAVLADALQLPDGVRLRVTARPDVPAASRVSLVPSDASDWEAASVNADHIEARLLQQCAVAAVGQAIPFWPAGRAKPISLLVTAASPSAVVRLVPDTELDVAPVLRGHNNGAAASAAAAAVAAAAPQVVPATAGSNGTTAATLGGDDDGDEDVEDEEEEGEEGEEFEDDAEDYSSRALVAAAQPPPAAAPAAPPAAKPATMRTWHAPFAAPAAAPPPGSRALVAASSAQPSSPVASHTPPATFVPPASYALPPGTLCRVTLVSGGATHDPEDAAAPPPPPRLPKGILLRSAPPPAASPLPPKAHVALAKGVREQLGAPLWSRLRVVPLGSAEENALPQPRRLTLHPLAPPPPKNKAAAAAAAPPPPPPPQAPGPGAAAAASFSASNAAALLPAHAAALASVGWDRNVPVGAANGPSNNGAPPPDGALLPPPPQPASARASAAARAAADRSPCDAGEAASRLVSAWRASQPYASRGVPLQDGALVRLTGASRQPGTPNGLASISSMFSMLGGLGAVPFDESGFDATFVLRCDPPSCLWRGADAAGQHRGATAAPQVALGPPLPRPYAKEGSDGTPWPPIPPRPLPTAPLGAPPLSPDAIAEASLPWARAVPAAALARCRALLSSPRRSLLSSIGAPAPGSVLLHGAPGVGRTAVALAIGAALAADPDCLAWVATVSCAALAGEEPDTQQDALEAVISAARGRRPAVIILDDLDILLPAPDDVAGAGAAPGGPADAAAPLAEMLADWMDAVQPGLRSAPQPVIFLATVAAPNALPAVLRASGRFDLELEVTPPGRGAREELLLRGVGAGGRLKGGVGAGAASDAAAATEGYDQADLAVLAERAVLAAAGKLLAPPSAVAPEKMTPQLAASAPPPAPLGAPDFAAGRAGLLPAALRGAGVSGGGAATAGAAGADANVTDGWAGVGGMASLKAALEEALLLPTQHAALFASAPLRLRTGALLYGPPGTGKTLIARAAASAAGLRLIGVKGPELLNKYIGQSEAGVRALFKRAAAAAPCVLFFDEFDAIAPRRGHDNTGVTDRVVNQLLAELDGIEALKGVAVVAATSRPDLLDPALLRPGRLDRMLRCNLPDTAERRSILAALAPGFGVDAAAPPMASALDAAAAATNGCSGADLAALLSEAQLEAAKEAIAAAEAAGPDGVASAAAAKVRPEHVRSATAAARPSVSTNEAARLDAIYTAFIAGRAGGLGADPAGIPSLGGRRPPAKGKRATLA